MHRNASLFTRNFSLLAAGQFLQALGLISIILLPVYLDFLGASRATIGAVLGVGALSGLLTRPLVGWSLDRLGRKPTVFFGILLATAGMVGQGFVFEVSAFLYGCQVLFGAGIGAMFTGYFTFASDHIPEERRTEGIAIFGVFGLIPLGLNGVVEQLGVTPEELRLVFPVVGGLVLSAILLLLPVPEVRSAESRRSSALPPVAEVLRSLAVPRLQPVWLAAVLFSSSVATFMAFATVTATSRGVDGAANIWLAYAGAAVGVRTLGSSLPDRVGPSRMVAPAMLLYALGLSLTAFSQSYTLFLIAGVLCGAGHGYCFPLVASQVVTRAPEVLRGLGFAVFTGLWDFCQFAIRPLCGAIADRHGDAAMYLVLTASVVAGLVLWALSELRAQRAMAVEAQL